MSGKHKSRRSESKTQRSESLLLSTQAIDQLADQFGLLATPFIGQFNYNGLYEINATQEARVFLLVASEGSSYVTDATPITSIPVGVSSSLSGGLLVGRNLTLLELSVNMIVDQSAQDPESFVQLSVFTTTALSTAPLTQISPVLIVNPSPSSNTGTILSGKLQLNLPLTAGTTFALVLQIVSPTLNDGTQVSLSACITYQ